MTNIGYGLATHSDMNDDFSINLRIHSPLAVLGLPSV